MHANDYSILQKQTSTSKINSLKRNEEKTNWQFTSSKNVYENNFFGITQKHILQFPVKKLTTVSLINL